VAKLDVIMHPNRKLVVPSLSATVQKSRADGHVLLRSAATTPIRAAAFSLLDSIPAQRFYFSRNGLNRSRFQQFDDHSAR
jgi:hypothetical protein